jgi:ATP-binding cassette subfamily B protein
LDVSETSKPLPPRWLGELTPQLEPGETLLAWLETDLDVRLCFAEHLTVLTDRRLLAHERSADAGTPANGSQNWPSWPLGEIASLRFKEHAGLGILEAIGPAGRLACWRFTAARSLAANRLIQRFDAFRRDGRIEEDLPADIAESACPGCGAPISADQGVCAACTPTVNIRPAFSLLRLSRFAKPRAGIIMLGFGLALATTAAGLVPPYMTMPLTDKVLIPLYQGKPVDMSIAGWCLGGAFAAVVLAWLLGWARTYVLAWSSERISADMRNETYAHLQRLSLEFFGGKRTGDLMSRISTDTDRINTFLSVNLLDFGNDVLMILLTASLLLSIDPLLALFTLAPFPIIGWLVHGVRNKLRRGFEQGGRAWGKMTSVLADTIPGIRVVKAFAQERREIERFHKANDHVLQANDRVNSTWSFFGPLVTLLTETGLLVIWACGIWRVSQGVEPGVLIAFVGYLTRFYTRLESMSRMVAATQRAAAGAQRIFEILDRVPTVPEPTRPVHPERIEGRIELRNVGFQYGNRSVVKGVNLTIEPGEMIGLVGASGAGKSTLVNLVCRFYDVGEGAVLVDGTDIRSFPVQEYRRHIGIVLQEPFLFYGTVAENIAYGRPDATQDEIISAARAARAHEFILRLPDGYDSLVGERGQSLSGGERQRISIARALLIDPKILILDEATSSVDTETEREIQEALDNLIQGRTTIAIAHRLSTLRRAARLVVMERGQIVEVGHHVELLKTPGAYARLHHAQTELAKQSVGI